MAETPIPMIYRNIRTCTPNPYIMASIGLSNIIISHGIRFFGPWQGISYYRNSACRNILHKTFRLIFKKLILICKTAGMMNFIKLNEDNHILTPEKGHPRLHR
jgi:hypothetical protein